MDGELSRAARLLNSLGVANVDEGVLEQLRSKNPPRRHEVPAATAPASQSHAPVLVIRMHHRMT